MHDAYKPGAWNAICDRCGFKFKNDQLKREWNNLRTCKGAGTNNCWEPKHPQEGRRVPKDDQTVPWTRPEGPDVEYTPPSWDDL